MPNYLDTLLQSIDDPELQAALSKEIEHLREGKQFGLVFERHLPETVRLYSHPIRAGLMVQRKTPDETATWLVQKVRKGVATLTPASDERAGEDSEADEPLEVDISELVVVREFGDPIYPGLKSVGRIERGGDKPFHAVINSENYHALETLLYAYEGKVDCIYIDPPYNLGGDLTYNDHRISREDAFRHSKWLSFMDRRLRLAKPLLKSTGVIIVAIDDTEMAHLRLLMDQLFGESNFLATVIWQGGRKNDSRYVSVGHDYMLIYAKNESVLNEGEIRFLEPKSGLEEIYDAARTVFAESDGDPLAATAAMKAWFRQLPDGHPALSSKHYNHIDDGGRVFFPGDISWPGGGGTTYPVKHPVTGKKVRMPAGGWRYASPERMAEMIAAGKVFFGPDESKIPNLKRYLDETEGQVPDSVFYQDRRAASRSLKNILGEKRFTHPKDVNVLARWIDLVTRSRKDAIVLDFFAGSGATAQAVMELNQVDGGRRQSVLVTNNELDEGLETILRRKGLGPGDDEWETQGIFQRVTRPRLAAVVSGTRDDGSNLSTGLDENVAFLELTYEDRDRISLGRAFEAVAPLLWMKAGSRGPVISKLLKDEAWALPEDAVYGVLFDAEQWGGFVDAVKARPDVRAVFVVTNSTSVFQQVAGELPDWVDVTMLYEDYLSTFEINTGSGE